MGPLCKIWESLETNKEQESFVSINGLIKFVKFQSIISVGQTNIALSYHRPFSALADVIKSTIQAKPMLKNKSELLQKKNLFDKKFREQISETVKAHKQSKQLLASAIFKDATNGNQPFRKGPCHANNIVGEEGGQSSYKNNSKRKSWNFNQNNEHNGEYANENNLFQGDANSNSSRKIIICSQAGKSIILVWSTSKCSDSWKTERLCKNVDL